MMKLNNCFIFFPLLALSITRLTFAEDCVRSFILEDIANLNNPNYDAERDRWVECMRYYLGDNTYFGGSYGGDDPLKDNPVYQHAVNQCNHLAGYSEELFMSPDSVRVCLINHMQDPHFQYYSISGFAKKSDYVFTGSFEYDINDGSVIDDESGTSGKPVKSRFILELYYNGKPRELIKRWKTEKNINCTTAHKNSMLRYPSSKIRRDCPIYEKLLKDFEKVPASLKIEPEKNKVYPNEIIDVKISDIADEQGRKSREFNRLVVKAEYGAILNGEPIEEDDLSVFLAGDGNITLKYQAPGDTQNDEDTITVYLGCDILDTDSAPLCFTRTKKKQIGETKIGLKANNGYATFSRMHEGRMKEDRVDKGEDGGTTWTDQTREGEKTSVSITGKAKQTHGLQMIHLKQYWEYYQFEGPLISSYYVTYKKIHDGAGGGYSVSSSEVGEYIKPELVTDMDSVIILIYDSEKKRMLDIKLPSYNVKCEGKHKYDLVSTNPNGEVTEKHESFDKEFDFPIGRVKDPDEPLQIQGNDKAFYGQEQETKEDEKDIRDGWHKKTVEKDLYRWGVFFN